MQTHTLATAVGAMNYAATQDLRGSHTFKSIAAVLETGAAPSQRAQRMYELLVDWNRVGAHRLDLDLDGKIDDPGAAIMDRAWPKIANAVMSPVLGPLITDLGQLMGRDNAANNQGSSYGSGWYGYVDKDLRRLAGRPVTAPYQTRFCGAGDLSACRASLWAALEEAGSELEQAQGTADPAAWRSNATTERIVFFPGVLPATMRWTNRPTFQQVISFDSHR